MKGIFAIARAMVLELIRKKDIYLLLVFMLALMWFLASRTFFNIEGASRYVKDLGYSLTMFFSFIVAVTFGARQVPAEIEARTVYPLLAKPIGPHHIVIGKFAGTFFVSAVSFTAFFVMFSLFCLPWGGSDAVLLCQAYIAGLLFLLTVSGMVIFLSTFLTVSASVSLMVIFYLASGAVADWLNEAAFFSKGVVSYAAGILFYLVPHLEFFDMRVRLTHSWDPLSAQVMGLLAAYTLLCVVFFIFFSGNIFSRKKL